MTAESAVDDISRTRLRAVRVLTGVAAVGAVGAAVSTVPVVIDAGASTTMVETWRLFGYLTFGGLFVLLGWRPRAYPWLWELVILNKLLLTATAATYVLGPDDVVGASAAMVSDGLLTAGLLAAYVAARAWQRRPSTSGSM